MLNQGAEREARTVDMGQGNCNRGGSYSAGGGIAPHSASSSTKKSFEWWLLQLCGLRLNGEEVFRGKWAYDMCRVNADADLALYLTDNFLTDVACLRC